MPGVNRARIADSVFFLCTPFVQALSFGPALLLVLGAAAQGMLEAWAALAGLSLLGALAGSLLAAAADVNRARVADSVFFLCTPVVQALSLVPMLLLALGAAARGMLGAWAALAGLSLLGAAFGSLLAAAALSILCPQKLSAPGVLLFPLFMVSFIPLQILSLFCRTTQWKAIRHGGGVEAQAA